MFEAAAFAAQGLGGWLDQFQDALTWRRVIVGLLISAATFAGSMVMVSVLLVRLPATFFHPSHERDFLAGRHAALRLVGAVLKNLAGVLLVALGIVMSLPGVPGQGILTILIGIMLLDFPGKRELERKIVRRPKVLRAINGLRARFDKPPLVLE
ncbi:MAG TPA: hypothetical protein VGB17_05915 [Pyrinomonadaceae bacterium]|jgi:hypothetical protein